MIAALAGQVRDLVNKVGKMEGPCTHSDLRQTIDDNEKGRPVGVEQRGLQSEVREYFEREKRKSSVFLRGCPCNSADEIQKLVDEISHALNIDRVILQNVQSLNTRGLFRVMIENSEGRRNLLENAKKLKNVNRFRNIYINRDLTYQQRQQLKERKKHTGSGNKVQHSAGSIAGVVSGMRGRASGVRGRGGTGADGRRGRGSFLG